MRLLPASARTAQPWRNGAGSTLEVAHSGGPDFDWRISIATVEGASEFSAYPGVDRVLLPLTPGGLGLVVNGRRVHLDRWQQLAFAGELPVSSIAGAGATDDLNLMTRRSRCSGSVSVGEAPGILRAAEEETLVLVVLDGSLEHDGGALGRYDAVQLGSGESLRLRGRATVAVARITAGGQAPPTIGTPDLR